MLMPDRAASPGTVGEALARATSELRRAGVSEAGANAELLLAHLLDTDRGGLFVRRHDPLDAAVGVRYAGWVRRRASREPLQHVTGEQEFHGLMLKADRRALVPRPETEGLVEVALNLDLPDGARVADLGTGSGCIAIALAVERADLVIDALDRSSDALELARENAVRHDVAARVRFTRCDLATPPTAWRAVMHLVVSNPPYVTEPEWENLEPEVRDHDPRAALVAGPTGLEAYAALAPASFGLLRPGGRLVLELGDTQAGDVREIVTRAGFEVIAVRPDLRGIDRVLVAVKPPSEVEHDPGR
jgi:release factor glutamine methyltransferase